MSPGCVDPNLAQHLPHDHLDVLVVDVHTLRSVDLLDFLHQVQLDGLAALDQQDVLRILASLGDLVARLNAVPFSTRSRAAAGITYSRSSFSS